MNDNCIFCKIISGGIPSYKVFEDDNFLAILDAAPAAKGHTIILAKNHSRNLLDADNQVLEKLLPTAKKIAASLNQALDCSGINILQNNEAAAGQTVFHLHMHVIPRYDNDSCSIAWEKASYEEGEAQLLAQKLSTCTSPQQ